MTTLYRFVSFASFPSCYNKCTVPEKQKPAGNLAQKNGIHLEDLKCGSRFKNLLRLKNNSDQKFLFFSHSGEYARMEL